MAPPTTPEQQRLDEAQAGKKWRRWGTYLSERQWGTVREDYSADGDAWRSFSHEDAMARAYRWGEDGILGLCDNRGLLCFAWAMWNGKDPFLKERLFGLTNAEGNHGEDVKELYWYLDATPTCSYARALYKYPQEAFPYARLRELSSRAGRGAREPELLDTGVLDGDRYFDVQVEYAKGDVDDVCVRVTVTNRAAEPATMDLLPSIWFRNTWSWLSPGSEPPRPSMGALPRAPGFASIRLEQSHLGTMFFYAEGDPELCFTDNDSNLTRLYGVPNASPYVKDAFHRHVVDREEGAVCPDGVGTKACARYRIELAPGASTTLRLRLTSTERAVPFADVDDVFVARIRDADAFYAAVIPAQLGPERRRVYRQAMAGLLWTKQFYFFDVDRWLRGDPASPPPPAARRLGRNHEWRTLYNSEILSMPDKWEYPWYAAWDLAFHTLPLAIVDPEYAKLQLSLLSREWYMHPNGQLPAYEWSFGDVNPPVHAWAALRVYQIERKHHGRADRPFLESIFHKLMLNFTWWVNRKDASGNNVFEGGFLGLDNISVFDRSSVLPGGAALEQADGTSWMGMYCLNLLQIALTLAEDNPSYQDVANKFFEHFLLIAHAMNDVAGEGICLWDEEDGFYYDVLHTRGRDGGGGESVPMRLRSVVGLIPLFAVLVIDAGVMERFPTFVKRVRWFLDNRPELARHLAVSLDETGTNERRLLSLVDRCRLQRILARLLDEAEFLSPFGIRSMSRAHKDVPYEIDIGGERHRVEYEPAESRSGLKGGNSNWRGPVWFPVNFLLIEALQKYHHYYGNELRVECPTGSGNLMTLWEVASEISRRLVSLFERDLAGHRPADGPVERVQTDASFRDHVSFYEYFDGDTGAGLGASHQTGWTSLVVKLLQQSPLWERGHDAEHRGPPPSRLP